MRKIIPVLLLGLVLCGCGGDRSMEDALAVRSRLLGADCTFRCAITADYIDHYEEFELECRTGADGSVEFAVLEPEEIRGIRGSVLGTEGTMVFEDLVLAFPLLADERLSPVAAPWLLIHTIRSGYITASVYEGELLHLTIDDTYGEDPLTLEVWLEGDGEIEACEIGWRGRRLLSMEVEDFAYV